MKKSIRSGVISLFFIAAGWTWAAADIPVQNSDADIFGVLSVIDQNEIQAAQLAEQKTIDHNVFDYARMLDVDRNKHLDWTMQLSQELGMPIEDNTSLEKLRDQGSEDLAALTALDAEDFAQLYIEDMIKEYSEVLDWINLQDAQNKQVKEFLDETRKYVAMHLEKARKIQEYQQNRRD